MCSEVRSTRVCRTCGVEKPLDKEHFYWRKEGYFRRECKECWKEKQIIQKFTVDYKKYHKLLKSQGYRCGICKCKLESSRYTKFAVDHDHKTGEVRGLLCTQCNTALGLFKDSTERLESAIKYLQNTPCEDIV